MRNLCLVLLFACLSACSGDPPRAPVEDRQWQGQPAQSWQPTVYTVSRGDTLFAIAWRSGMDYRDLARFNNIARPYTIYPGQKLTLKDDGKARTTAAAGSTPKPAANRRPASGSESSTSVAAATGKATAASATTAGSQAAKGSAPSKSVPAAKSAARKPAGVPQKTAINWRWPTRGKVERGFSGTLHKGIDIGGKSGDPVASVAAGQVVYAGNGIVGYGELLIIKHNDIYLSAYGHNSQLLVSEGATVKAGQVIAEKGSSATNSVKLHFEIRREGKPVNPLKLLPVP